MVARGLAHGGRRISSGPTSVRALLESSAVTASGEHSRVPRLDIAYAGPGLAGIPAMKALLEASEYRLIIFCGLAGALDPALRPGDILESRSLLRAGEADCHVRPLLAGRIRTGVFLSVDRLVSSPEEKLDLRVRTGADAVDMESDAWMGCALQAGVPATVCRVISDGASESLPPEIVHFVRPTGEISMSGIVRSFFARPACVLDLWVARREIRLGRQGLESLGNLLGDLVGSGFRDARV